jgi:hypothetical protein
MEKIIRKAIEGGFTNITERDDWLYRRDLIMYAVVIDTHFWKALGEKCGWEERNYGYTLSNTTNQSTHDAGAPQWKFIALRFHEINLTEGWEPAVKYLTEVTK